MSNETRTACAQISLDQLVAILSSSRFDLTTEAAIQLGIDRLLAAELGPSGYRREHRLSGRDRVDFLVDGRIALEVKHFRARAKSIQPQLERYAEHDQVEALVLVTGRPAGFPSQILGKPLRVIGTGAAWL